MFKIIDYAGDVLATGFKSEVSAWYWLVQNYSKEAIKEMEFNVRKEEEDAKSE